MLKKAASAVGVMLLACSALSLVLVLLGYGPWQRWLAPTALISVAWGVATLLRERRVGPAEDT